MSIVRTIMTVHRWPTRVSVATCLIVGGALLYALPAGAAVPESGGVTVTPAKLTLQLSKGQPKATAPVTLKNNNGQPVRFQAEFRNVQLTSKGTLIPTTPLEGELKDVLSLDQTEFVIEPGAIQLINVGASTDAELGPGGHYASLYIQQVADGNSGLAITPAVSVGLFVTREDGAVRSITLTELTPDGNILRQPSVAITTFGTSGNVAVVPRAVVTITDPRGKLISRGTVNRESLTLVPKGTLRLQTNLQRVDRSWLPGRYTLATAFRYDGAEPRQIAERSFWYIPPISFVGLAVVLIVVATIIRYRRVFYKPLRWMWGRLKVRRRSTTPAQVSAVPPRHMDVVAPKRRKKPKDN